MDALVAELTQRWPSLRSITIAGFSAGGQMVQHYAGFAQTGAAVPVAVRYVVADPGTWLYFDPVRPQPMRAGAPVEWSSCGRATDPLGDCTLAFSSDPDGSCPALNRWKYGSDDLPAELNRTAADARRRYAQADISYLEGELDANAAKGTAYRVLDRSCAAAAQGPYRLQRGLAYAQYDRTLLAPEQQRRLVVVPGCAHDVACVFPAEAARSALLGGR
jgi:pimeloyl-ACP methyl ester carboxylesterase